MLRSFVKAQRAQDLIEYSLLLAFLAVVCAIAFLQAGASTQQVWNTAQSRLAQAHTASRHGYGLGGGQGNGGQNGGDGNGGQDNGNGNLK